MIFEVTVWSPDRKREERWSSELRAALRSVADVQVHRYSERGKPPEQILFLDGTEPESPVLLEFLDQVDRRGKAVFLIVEDGDDTPDLLLHDQVEDVLVHPFRPVEVLSKLRHYQHILAWDEVVRLNTTFKDLLDHLHDDLRIVEDIQKRTLPQRFPEVKGMKVASRYLVGSKSGGDHFDIAESARGDQLSMVLTDASSYGLSSAILSIMMKVAVKLSVEQLRSSADTVKNIREELTTVLSEKDQLSLFYGTLSRKDYKLRYVNLGTSRAFYGPPGKKFVELTTGGPALARTASGELVFKEEEVALDPRGRLVLLSDGFVEVLGGSKAARAMLDQFRDREALESLNELVFKVKSKYESEDDMPAQDCTGIVFDVDAKVLRLAG